MNKADTSSQNDFFQEIKRRERRRIQDAVERTREVVLKNHFPCLHDCTLKEVGDYEKLLERIEALILLGAEGFCKHLPSPLEETRERSKWEVYLSGLRYFTRRYPQGFFRKTTLAFKEWKEFPDRIDAYSEKCLSGFSDFTDLAGEIKKYCINYSKAREIARRYIQNEEEEPEDEDIQVNEGGYKELCRLYASLKSWEKEEDLSHFNNYLEKSRAQFFEVIIEGPIQLYLFIGEETWFFVLKILTIEHLGDFFFGKNKKELQDLRDVHKFAYEIVERSEIYETFKQFVQEALKIYVDNLQQSEKRLRGQYPTDELKRKFIRRFENGEIFKKGD